MLKYATTPDSPFITEGIELLVSEFGRDYGTYFLISKSSLLPQPNLHKAVIHRIAFQRAIYEFLVNK